MSRAFEFESTRTCAREACYEATLFRRRLKESERATTLLLLHRPPHFTCSLPSPAARFQCRLLQSRHTPPHSPRPLPHAPSTSPHLFLPDKSDDLASGLQIPEVRSTGAKALGRLCAGLGEEHFPDLLPWLFASLCSDGAAVERAGASLGLAEVRRSLSFCAGIFLLT